MLIFKVANKQNGAFYLKKTTKINFKVKLETLLPERLGIAASVDLRADCAHSAV